MPPRILTCSNYVLDNMEYAVGRLYVANYFNGDSKSAATNMILNIQNEFKRSLKRIEWMENESKKAALEKVIIFISVGSRLSH